MNDKELNQVIEYKNEITKLLEDLKDLSDERPFEISHASRYGLGDLQLNLTLHKFKDRPLMDNVRKAITREIVLEIIALVGEIKKLLPEYEVTDPILVKILETQKSEMKLLQANLDNAKIILDNYAS